MPAMEIRLEEDGGVAIPELRRIQVAAAAARLDLRELLQQLGDRVDSDA